MNNYCNNEGRASVFHSLQAAEDGNSKHNGEATEKSYQFHQELGSESFLKERKVIFNKDMHQKIPSALSYYDESYDSI